jgi:hypothetical protein
MKATNEGHIGTIASSFLQGVMLIIMKFDLYMILSLSSFEASYLSFEELIIYFLIFYFDTEIPCKEAEPCNQ